MAVGEAGAAAGGEEDEGEGGGEAGTEKGSQVHIQGLCPGWTTEALLALGFFLAAFINSTSSVFEYRF